MALKLKRNAVVIISNDANNRAAATITVIPITSNVSKVYPFEVLLREKDSGLPPKLNVIRYAQFLGCGLQETK